METRVTPAIPLIGGNKNKNIDGGNRLFRSWGNNPPPKEPDGIGGTTPSALDMHLMRNGNVVDGSTAICMEDDRMMRMLQVIPIQPLIPSKLMDSSRCITISCKLHLLLLEEEEDCRDYETSTTTPPPQTITIIVHPTLNEI